MLAILRVLGIVVANLFKSRSRLEAENVLLRHQLNVALRQTSRRPVLRGSDRALMAWMIRAGFCVLASPRFIPPPLGGSIVKGRKVGQF